MKSIKIYNVFQFGCEGQLNWNLHKQITYILMIYKYSNMQLVQLLTLQFMYVGTSLKCNLIQAIMDK